jgi:hypothetical protein
LNDNSFSFNCLHVLCIYRSNIGIGWFDRIDSISTVLYLFHALDSVSNVHRNDTCTLDHKHGFKAILVNDFWNYIIQQFPKLHLNSGPGVLIASMHCHLVHKGCMRFSVVQCNACCGMLGTGFVSLLKLYAIHFNISIHSSFSLAANKRREQRKISYLFSASPVWGWGSLHKGLLLTPFKIFVIFGLKNKHFGSNNMLCANLLWGSARSTVAPEEANLSASQCALHKTSGQRRWRFLPASPSHPLPAFHISTDPGWRRAGSKQPGARVARPLVACRISRESSTF